jgi:putative ABC transport system permease protein
MSRWKCPTLWKYTAREMRRRPGRTLLTLLSIVIGVATVVATWVAAEATRHAYRDLFEQATGRAALEVVAEGYAGFDGGVAAELEGAPGVRAALPVVQAPAAIAGAGGTVPVLVLGIDPERDRAVRDYALRQGRPLGTDDGLLLEAGFAASCRCAVGDRVRLWTPTGPAALPVVGLLAPSSAAAFNGGAVAFVPLGTAQRLFALGDEVNAVQLLLDEGADPREVEAGLRGRLPKGLRVQPPADRGALTQDILLYGQQGFGCLSIVSLVGGAFIILNSFLMSLGERRGQLAVLRALGATRGQVTRLLLREALALGLCGTALGIGAGVLLTLLSVRAVATVLGVAPQDVSWTAGPFLAVLLLGPGMSLAATFLPARRAGNSPPLEELTRRPHVPAGGFRRWPCYVGLGLLSAPLLLDLGFRNGLFLPSTTPALIAVATTLFLAGGCLAVPLLLSPLLRFAGLILRPFPGVARRLAVRHLDRHRARTALTAGVLMIAVTFAIVFGTALLNHVQGLRAWYTRLANGSFYVRSAIPDLTTLVTGAALPESVGADLEGLDGVERVDRISATLAHVGDQQVLVMAMTASAGDPFPFGFVQGDPSGAAQKLAAGEVLVGHELARRLRLGVGDAVPLETPLGPRALKVAGTVRDYSAGGMVVIMDWDRARQLLGLKGILCFVVRARPGRAAALAGELQRYCGGQGLLVQSNAEFHAWFEHKIEGTVAFCWALLALVFVVSSAGIVNTLTMNIREQTREIGVLRAVGMKRSQVRAMVLCQAVVIGVAGLVPGLVLGIGWSFLIHWPGDSVFGPHGSFRIDYRLVIACSAGALGIPVLAALLPSRWAARLPAVQALRYE